MSSVLTLVALCLAQPQAWVDREVAGQGYLPALSDVVAAAEAEAWLSNADDPGRWRYRVRHRAWIPNIETRVGTDRSLDVRDATTTSWVRTGEGFGVQVRLQWALANALFDAASLKVEKTLRDRGEARWRFRDRVVRLYFQRVELEIRRLSEPSMDAVLAAAEGDGLLRTLTGGRVQFGRRRGNPWPSDGNRGEP